jgi:hypothetical protein
MSPLLCYRHLSDPNSFIQPQLSYTTKSSSLTPFYSLLGALKPNGLQLNSPFSKGGFLPVNVQIEIEEERIAKDETILSQIYDKETHSEHLAAMVYLEPATIFDLASFVFSAVHIIYSTVRDLDSLNFSSFKSWHTSSFTKFSVAPLSIRATSLVVCYMV